VIAPHPERADAARSTTALPEAAVETTVTAAADDLPASTHRQPRSLRPRLVDLGVLFLFLAIAAAIVVTNVHRSPGMGVYDETTHADYAYRIAHGEIPAKGGVLAPEIRRESACHGKSINIEVMPACQGKVIPPASAFAANGEDYNFEHPPVYYAITGGLARLSGVIVGGSGHFITLGRLVGIGWLASAMFVLYLALLVFRVPLLPAIAGGALLAAVPSVAYESSLITNDAAAALGGSIALCILAGALVDGRVRPIPLFIWAALVTGTKVINSLPFLAVGGLFAVIALVAWRRAHRERAKAFAKGAVAIAVGVLAVYEGWSVYQSGRGVANWVNPIAHISGRPYRGLPFDEWASTLFSGFPPTTSDYLPAVLSGQEMTVYLRILPIITGAAAIGLVVVFRRGEYQWQLGAALLAGLMAFPILVQVQVFLVARLYFPLIPARYGMSLVPWCIAAVAIIAAWRPFTRTFLAGTVVALAVGMASYLGIH
jgi:hypothetical protein